MRFFFRSRVDIVLSLLVICSAYLALLISTRSGVQAASPHLSLSRNVAPPTTVLQVSGTNFSINEAVKINFDTNGVSTTTTDSRGTFTTKITVPSSALPGNHTIQARSQISGITAQAPILVQADWSMFGFNNQHTNDNPYENVLTPSSVSSLALDWTDPSSSATHETSPTVANGVVYIGSDNTVIGFNAATGNSIWSYTVAGLIWSAPTVVNGVVYVGSYDKNIYAINVKTGELLWNYTTAGKIASSPVVFNGVVYVGSMDNSLYALNAKTGILLWKAITGSYIIFSPAIANGMVFAASDKMYAFNAATGVLLWTYSGWNSTVSVSSSPVAANGIVYLGVGQTLFALNTKTGAQLWGYSILSGQSSSFSTPGVANNVVYAGADKLYAFNAKTGALLWTYSDVYGLGFGDSLAIADGVVYTGLFDLYAIDAKRGILLWSYTHIYSNFYSPAVANGVIYINADKLYAFHLPGMTP